MITKLVAVGYGRDEAGAGMVSSRWAASILVRRVSRSWAAMTWTQEPRRVTATQAAPGGTRSGQSMRMSM